MQKTHFTIVQGTPFELLVTVTQKSELDVVTPMPLTDCDIRLQARAHVRDARPLLELNLMKGIVVVDNSGGKFALRMSAEETSALRWQNPRAAYQCEVTPPNGDTIRVLDGTLTLDLEVVR